MGNLRKVIGLLFLCLFSFGDMYAKAVRKIVQYQDGTVIEGMVEKKFFVDGPMRIYSSFGESVEWSGEYQGNTNRFSGILRIGEDFQIECTGLISTYTDNKQTLNRRFSDAGSKTGISASKTDVQWKLSYFRFVKMVEQSLPDIQSVFFDTNTWFENDDSSKSFIQKLYKYCSEGYNGKAMVVFKNGNTYEGTVYVSKTKKLTLNAGEKEYITFTWENGDSYRGEAQVNENGICFPGRGGIMTYSNGQNDRMYPGETASEFDNVVVQLYANGEPPYQVKIFIDEQKKEIARKEEDKQKQKEYTEQQAKKEADLRRKAACLRKYGTHWGELVYKRELALGMTQEMCEDVVQEKSFYKVSEALFDKKICTVWQLDDNAIRKAVASHSESMDEAWAGLFTLGVARQFGWSPYTCLVFSNGILIAYE